MTCFEAEKQLVLFLAGVLDLVPDREIFSNALPDGVPEGIWAKFERGRPADLAGPNSFTARVRGRFRSRAACALKADSIVSALPVFGVNGLLSIRTGEGEQVTFPPPEEDGPSAFDFSILLSVDFV